MIQPFRIDGGSGYGGPEPGDDVNETKRCDGDPLKDMDIRPTCAGIEGGRYGEEARTDAEGDPVSHWGLDLGGSDAEIGTEISAIEGGTVRSSTNYSDDFGNYVIVSNGNTWYLYAHLSKVTVEAGSSIDGGDKIGEMGKSGNAGDADCNPVHLHLEVRKNEGSWPTDAESTSRDPEKYIGTEFSSGGEPVSDEC
jgi:murein DD-endopeptidase MepM/ murein hydrolase activator NlpD